MLSPAYQSSHIFILYLLLARSLTTIEAQGTTHVVGGSDGWNLFVDSSSWANGQTFRVGDALGKC